MTTWLITGAAGFIGSNLAIQLVEKGHDVKGIDNLLSGKEENLDCIKERIEFTKGDIRDRDLMQQLCKGVDYVLHHAALASVPWSMEDPALTHEHNVGGTLNTLTAARDNGVKKVVCAVTSAAYGDTEVMPLREDLPLHALSPYAATKIACEIYLRLFSDVFRLPAVGLRYFNVFGPRQDPDSAYAAAIPVFMKKLLNRERPVIFGDGEQTRDFVFIDDVVSANIAACNAGREADGQVFNIGTGKARTVNDLCYTISSLLETVREPVHTDRREGDVTHSVADISKAERYLGYSPKHTVRSGLEKALDWYRENLK